MLNNLKNSDNEIYKAIEEETARQYNKIELIASENYVSQDVLAVAGSILTNKYAEGYPERRYYGGCEHVDTVETLAINRAKEVFKAEHANVQPHSGSQANMAVYFSVLQPGDTVLAMNLNHGGHLTHGSAVNFSGKLFNFVFYGVDSENEQLNYEDIYQKASKYRPKLIIAGASAYARTIDFKKFRAIADEFKALLLVDMAHIAGLVAGGVHVSPVPYADFVTTTTHKTLRGPRGGLILCKQQFAKRIDSNIFPGMQGGPLMHIIAAKAVALKEALQPNFSGYAQRVVSNARYLADKLQAKGFRLVSGGTDNHLLLIDLRNMDVTGKEVENWLDAVGITVNRNMVPNDPASAQVTSGIRIGTPAVTTRGFAELEMVKIADIIWQVVSSRGKPEVITALQEEVRALTKEFPLFKSV